jgi:hypothetical protein
VSSQSTPDDGDKQSGPTIIIKPAKEARYAFHDWKLELDQERILERLIYDVYDHPTVFVRELIQNALDATRCQMYVDFEAQNPGAALPERPTQFSAEFRDRYPVVLSLTEEEVKLSPDAPTEKRRVFTIEDHGTGMNEQIITRYFLQVGRSYYQSSEFRERFKFAPTSRFGVGFLSVFAVSKNITVDTARRDDATGRVMGLRLNLREPRNYLLTEPWLPFEDRPGGPQNGTRIRLVLDAWDQEVSLAELVTHWCVAVEVPVIIRDAGQNTVIRAQRKVDKTVLATSKVDPNGCFILRAFDLNAHGVEGQVAIIAYKDDKGEGWCDCWPEEKGLDGEREDVLPQCKHGFTALHGIQIRLEYEHVPYRHRQSQWCQWVDVRSPVRETALDRSVAARRLAAFGRLRGSSSEDMGNYTSAERAVEGEARRVVERHLAESLRAKGEFGALYRGRVLSAAPVADAWRDQYPGTVVTWRSGQREDISVAQLLALQDLVFAAWPKFWLGRPPPGEPTKRHPKDVHSSLPIVSWSDTPRFSDERFRDKVLGMNLCGIEWHGDLCLLTFSNTTTDAEFERAHANSFSWVAPLWDADVCGISVNSLCSGSKNFYILNRNYQVVRWLSRLRVAAMAQPPEVDSAAVEACWLTAASNYWEVSDLMAAWEANPRVPEALKPPKEGRGSLGRFHLNEVGSRSTLRG